MLDWILDKLRAVTRARRDPPRHERPVRAATSSAGPRRKDVTVHDDGTTSNEDRLGAIGDIAFALEQAGIDDDVLVVAGDNLFDFSLADYVDCWRARATPAPSPSSTSATCELASQYGVVDVAEDDRIVGIRREARRPAEHAGRDRDLPLPPRSRPARRALPRGGQPARPARQLHRLAAPARAGVRVPVCRRVARHRRQGAAARRRQPLRRQQGCPSAPSTSSRFSQPARFVHALVTDRDVASRVCCSTSCCRPVVPPVSCPGLRSVSAVATL